MPTAIGMIMLYLLVISISMHVDGETFLVIESGVRVLHCT